MRSVDLRGNGFLQKINCPVLVTRRLVLRLPHSEDIEALVTLADNRHIISQFDEMPSPFTRAAAEDFVSRAAKGQAAHYVYAVTRADTGEFIGCCGFGGNAGKMGKNAEPPTQIMAPANEVPADGRQSRPYKSYRRQSSAEQGGAALLPADKAAANKNSAGTEIFFWLGEPYWRRGYGTEIAAALIDAAFRATELEALYARLHDTNAAARKILQKCGFSLLYSSGYIAQGADRAQALAHYSLSRDCWLDLRRLAPRRAI
ncbi:MAG: N-acetyltransferase [Candidatus Tokpelaia sp.]|nr:MAG: N-acetyltransferase [Candidatus Tokpelaia sp.]KAA6207276.1 MAG: N-acetyltransferase [Candidatus Tokpelaia sp.]